MAKKSDEINTKYEKQRKILEVKAQVLGINSDSYPNLSDLRQAIEFKEKEDEELLSDNIQKIIAIRKEKERQQKLRRITFVDHSQLSSDDTYREIVVSNELHTMRWTVPTRLDGANSWHVPQLIYDNMKQETFLQKPEDPSGGPFEAKRLHSSDANKILTYTKNRYSITDLPPLTEHELETLKLKARVGT